MIPNTFFRMRTTLYKMPSAFYVNSSVIALTTFYTMKNGKVITTKYATHSLVSRLIDRMRRHFDRSQDINEYTEELSVEIDHYEKKDYTEVDNTIERLGL